MKYELDQLIHYMRNNTPHSAPVLARMQVDNLCENWVSTPAQRDLFAPFGHGGVYYATCHGIVREDEAFATKTELLRAIFENVEESK